MGEYDLRYPNGKKIAGRMNLLLSLAGRDLGESMLARVVQGSYNKGGVAASAGTHDAGGAVDLSVSGWSLARVNEVLLALRKRGLIAWYRHPGQGFSPHIHGIDRGATDLSAGARQQVWRFDNGENGLASRAPDDGPRVPVPVFDYAAGLAEWEAGLPDKPPPTEKIAATYNTPHRLEPANLLPDLERLRDEHKVTLIAVQECTDDDVPWYGKSLGWDWWRPDRARSAGLLFAPDAWLPVRRKDGERRQGSYRLHTPGVKTPARWVVWADLEHAATGEVLRVGSYHLVAFKTRSPRAAKEYLRQQGRLARWLRNGRRRVALGDLNGSRSRFWTPALKRDAVWAEPFLPTYGKATIDHVLRPKGQPQPQTLAAVDGHSDHRALIVRL